MSRTTLFNLVVLVLAIVASYVVPDDALALVPLAAMACSPSNLGAALAACGICDAAPPARRWMLADRVTTDRAGLGQTVFARLDSIPQRDSAGRYAHVKGIYIDAQAVATVAGATNDAVSAYQLRGLFEAIFLEGIEGHMYWNALDARTIIDDQWYRQGYRRVQYPYMTFRPQDANGPFAGTITDNGYATNLTAGTYARNASWYAPLTRQPDVEGSPLEGLIPLASLQRKGADALRIRVRSTLQNGPAGTPPAGIVFTRFENSNGDDGFDIWLDVVYLPAIVIDAPWQLDQYSLMETSGLLRHPGRKTEYVAIRYFPEDQSSGATDGQSMASLHSGVTIRVAGFTETGGYSLFDMTLRDLITIQSDPHSALVRNNNSQDLPIVNTNNVIQTMILLPNRPREHAAAGPVTFEYATRTDVTFTRYIHRTVACHTQDRGQRIADALGCDPCAVIGTDGMGKMCNTPNSTEPVVVVPNDRSRLVLSHR